MCALHKLWLHSAVDCPYYCIKSVYMDGVSLVGTPLLVQCVNYNLCTPHCTEYTSTYTHMYRSSLQAHFLIFLVYCLRKASHSCGNIIKSLPPDKQTSFFFKTSQEVQRDSQFGLVRTVSSLVVETFSSFMLDQYPHGSTTTTSTNGGIKSDHIPSISQGRPDMLQSLSYHSPPQTEILSTHWHQLPAASC